MKKEFKFSVIIPIYNVEDYLEETIESVINQTIGFEKNIQLILVNDGSPDNSEDICLKYKNLYPDNVIYHKQKNAGVSAARNKGIQLAEGEFVNFLDSDDLWSLDTFKEVYKKHLKNPDVKVITTKMKFFDAKKGPHILNYKYKKDKLVDIRKDYSYIQLSTCSCFIDRKTLINYKYDLEIKNEEDTRLISEILVDNPLMIVLKKPIYYYRKRKNLSSASQTSTKSNKWYTVTPKNVYEYLFDLSVKKFGKVLDYFKYLVAYDIGWRINVLPNDEILNLKEQKEYIKCLKGLIDKIDYNIFLEQKNLTPTYLLYILKMKEGIAPQDTICVKENKIISNKLNEPNNEIRFIHIDDIYQKNNTITIFGKVNISLYDKEKISFIINDKKENIQFYELKNNCDEISFTNENIAKYIGLKVKFNIKDKMKFGFKYGEENSFIGLTFSKQSPITNLLNGSYYQCKELLLMYNNGTFKIEKNIILRRFIRENKNLFGLIAKKKFKQLAIRLEIIISKIFMPKNIWLLQDRVNKADDNAEHLFKYLNSNNIKNVNAYYAITKDSPDYNRLKKYGKVVDINSLKYKLLFVNAKYNISSHAETYITNLYGNNNQYYKDLMPFKYIFLQHGITQADISSWLNPNTKHIDMFVSAAKKEYESLLTYGYDKDVIQLTGFSRYDGLVEKSKKYKPNNIIMMSFTWRSSLANKVDRATGERLYNEDFKNTDYFKYLNNILNDEKLLKALKKYNYKIKFIPHPNVMTQLKDFTFNDYIIVEDGLVNYQKEFCENKILVTDLSSVFFDFAYLKKPVIHFFPDKEDFYKGQIYNKGYFDIDKMGFGPIFEDHDKFIDELIKTIKNDCELESKYNKRIDDFFAFHDQKNCERVYEKINKL